MSLLTAPVNLGLVIERPYKLKQDQRVRSGGEGSERGSEANWPRLTSSLSGADQHLHDAPVQLRERPPGPVHLQAPGAFPALLDQPPAADTAPGAAGPEVLPDLL